MPTVLFTSLHGYKRSFAGADALAGLTLLAVVVPEQLATSRLAGMPPDHGFLRFHRRHARLRPARVEPADVGGGGLHDRPAFCCRDRPSCSD